MFSAVEIGLRLVTHPSIYLALSLSLSTTKSQIRLERACRGDRERERECYIIIALPFRLRCGYLLMSETQNTNLSFASSYNYKHSWVRDRKQGGTELVPILYCICRCLTKVRTALYLNSLIQFLNNIIYILLFIYTLKNYK